MNEFSHVRVYIYRVRELGTGTRGSNRCELPSRRRFTLRTRPSLRSLAIYKTPEHTERAGLFVRAQDSSTLKNNEEREPLRHGVEQPPRRLEALLLGAVAPFLPRRVHLHLPLRVHRRRLSHLRPYVKFPRIPFPSMNAHMS